ncbi:phosphotransferase [Halopseudomonas pachastrellae]|nr:phosphotransferase [Halopseudomonas pachastrellae]
MPAMDALMKWLPENIPADESTTIAHGDFRIGNLMLHPTESKVVSILDWELATLGHPLSDLAYCCLPYHMPVNVDGAKGMVGADLKSLGLPEEQQLLDWYCEYTGRSGVPNWNYYIAFSLFRLAAIVQGVYHRALQGNASTPMPLKSANAPACWLSVAGKLPRSKTKRGSSSCPAAHSSPTRFEQ